MFNGKTTQNREMAPDILRFLAMLFVVIMYCVDAKLSFGTTESEYLQKSADSVTMTLVFVCFMRVLGRVGVFIAVMLSGYHLLDRDYEKPGAVAAFWKGKLLPLLGLYFVWNVFYEGVYLIEGKRAFNVEDFRIRELLLGNSKSTQLWFLPLIIGLYLTLPFISMVVKRISLKAMWLPMAIVFVVSSVFETYKLLAGWNGWDTIVVKFNSAFFGGLYVLIFAFGYYLKKEIIPGIVSKGKKKEYCILAGLVSLVCFILTGLFQLYSYTGGKYYKVTVSFVTVPVWAVSLAIFVLLLPEGEKIRKVFALLADTAFGVFCLYYYIYKRVIAVHGEWLTGSVTPIVRLLLIVIMVYGISFLIVYFVGKIFPPLSKALFLYDGKALVKGGTKDE